MDDLLARAAGAGDGPAGFVPAGSGHAVHYLSDAVRSTALRTSLTDAVRSVGFPHGSVDVADDTSLHTLACTGPSDPPVSVRRGSRCDLVVSTARPVVLPGGDRGGDRSGGSCAYLGVPLRGREGTVIGALSVTDDVPRAITDDEVRELGRHALVIEDHLDLHRRRSDLHLTPPGQGPGRRRSRRDGQALAEPGGDLAVATADLRRGLSAGEVVPHYEPVVDLRTGRVRGAEALARWEHPRWGLLGPQTFVPLAEDSDLVLDLDLTVLDRVVREARRWVDADPGFSVHVNLSGRHLEHLDCVERIEGVVARAGADPARTVLEITEGALVAESTVATEFVDRLRAAGFPVLLDDFGTGWSSMAYLLRLPVDGVKIDRSFTAALPTRTGEALVRAVVALAADLGLDTVIEGITTPAAAADALALGCGRGQGRLWGEPVDARRFVLR